MFNLSQLVDRWLIHLDGSLLALMADKPGYALIVFFLIIFLETGLVITPFLPGDSFLFAAGTLGAAGVISPWMGYVVLLAAAILGNSVNFAIGHLFGNWALHHRWIPIKRKHIEKTEVFFQKYGRLTLIVSRFFPIVRTIAPFLAGMGHMKLGVFTFYNVLGAFIWITSLYWGGYWLGSIPVVKAHFTEAVIVLIGLSLLPGLVPLFRRWFKKK